MLDLDVFRDGKTITVPVTMDSYRRFLIGDKNAIFNIDLDKGNVDALCFLDKDGFYQPHETDKVIVEFGGGKITFDVLDIEYNMFEKDPGDIDELIENDPNDDLLRPHALIKFTMKRVETPQKEFNYDEFNPATKAILDALRGKEHCLHNAWHNEDGKEEYVSSIPGDTSWESGIPASFKFTVSNDGKTISVVVDSYSPSFDKKDKQKILLALERINNYEKTVQVYLNGNMSLSAKASKEYPSAVEVSAGSTEMLLFNTHYTLGKVYEFISFGLEIGAL